MRLLTEDFDSEFARLMEDKRIDRVDIASAWVTDGPGLDALERAARSRSIKVRALVGISGGHTTPTALERLCNLGKVRLVDGSSLFHVKLYLFHRGTTSFVWIGSANFTRGGFESNEELIFETTDVSVVVDWFEDRWQKIDPTQSRKRLQEYCRCWEPPAQPRHDIVGLPDSKPPRDRRIVFIQKGERPTPLVAGGKKGAEPQGRVRISGRKLPYKSAQEALLLVLRELQRIEDSFLDDCWNDRRFHGAKNHYIARSKGALGTQAHQEYAQEVCDGWWMSVATETQKKWELIMAAADIAGMRVRVKGSRWEAESKARIEVGF